MPACICVSLALLVASATPKVSAPQGDAAFFRQVIQNFGAGRPAAPRIAPDGKTVFFLRSTATTPVRALYAFDVASGTTRELLTAEKILKGAEETLTPQERERRERMRVSTRGISSYDLSPDGRVLLVSLGGKLYAVEQASGAVTELKTGPEVIAPAFSPDGKQVAYVRDNDVYRLDLATNVEHRVTTGGTDDKSHGLPEFVAAEEMERFAGFWWSGDSKALAFEEADTSGVEKIAQVDPAHPEAGSQMVPYPRAGTANAKVRLGIAAIDTGKTIWVDWDAGKYPYLATVKWPAKGPLTILVQNRPESEELLLAVDAATGKARTLLTERDEAWLNLDQTFPLWLDDGSGFLWSTERNGGAELELHRADGTLARSLVPPEAGFLRLARYVERDGTVYFIGGPNPTERYVWRMKPGARPERVTPAREGPAVEMGAVSTQGDLIVLMSEGPKRMRGVRVLRPDGSVVGELPSVAAEPPFQPNFELRQVGKERFWTAIVRPRNFKRGVKLPVIVEIYGGGPEIMAAQRMTQNLFSQWIADHGYIVVKIDGRGNQGRGRAWERYQRFNFVGAIDDQVTALQALAAEIPELDLKRVGITGWSLGGYMSALAVLKRPDVFKAAAAGAPVVDWHDYDTHLTERILGLPQEHPDVYDRNSLLTYVKPDAPMGKLLLMHGTADDNVHFAESLKLSDALLRAGKPHAFLPVVGFTHMVADPFVYQQLWERVMQHFKDNL